LGEEQGRERGRVKGEVKLGREVVEEGVRKIKQGPMGERLG